MSSAPDLSECAFEILLDGFAAGITDGPGNWLVGGRVFDGIFLSSLELALSLSCRSAGVRSATTSIEITPKRLSAEAFEFTTGVSMGVHFLISRHFGLLLEGGYQHISNADIYPRNAGLNALGAQAGLFYFFSARRSLQTAKPERPRKATPEFRTTNEH